MAFDFSKEIIIPLCTSIGGTAFVVWFIKQLFAARIKKSFDEELEEFRNKLNKNLEDYKSSLTKENIAYQIHQAEFLRSKFEKVNSFFSFIIEIRTKRFKDYLEIETTAAANAALIVYQENDSVLLNRYSFLVLFFDKKSIDIIEKYVEKNGDLWTSFLKKIHAQNELKSFNHQNGTTPSNKLTELQTNYNNSITQFEQNKTDEFNAFVEVFSLFNLFLNTNHL